MIVLYIQNKRTIQQLQLFNIYSPYIIQHKKEGIGILSLHLIYFRFEYFSFPLNITYQKKKEKDKEKKKEKKRKEESLRSWISAIINKIWYKDYNI